MPFTARLLMMSPWLLYFLLNLVFIGGSLLVFFGLTRLINYPTRQSINDVASPMFNRAGAIYGILLAFVVVLMWQQYQKAVDNALLEGTAASALYRDLKLFPDQGKADKAIKSMVEFAQKVVADEYPAMAQMKASQTTDEALANLWRNAQRINPQGRQEEILYNEILRDLGNLSNLRNERLLEIESGFPGIIWGALIICGIITLIFSIFLAAEHLWIHAILISLFAIIIATIFFLIIELDYPFTGELSVKGTIYIKLLETVNQK